MSSVSFVLNGRPVTVDIRPEQTLLSVLRDTLCLTGTKRGCDSGECCACTVLVDGRARRSCALPAASAEGAHVETIEGLSVEGRLHPLQAAFLEEGAIQCGFCTPGMIMAAKGLLDAGGAADAEAIKRALRHHLCRCTGYSAIVAAVQRAARWERGLEPRHETAVGADVRAKVVGEALFAADLHREGMLHGAVVWSTLPHARIRRLDLTAVAQHQGVVTVLTAADIPGLNGIGLLRPDQPVLVDGPVRRVGEPLALVVATSEGSARAACREAVVEYDLLSPVCSVADALVPEAPTLSSEGNLLREFSYEDGDVDVALAGSAVTVRGRFCTPFVEHAYLETEATLADMDDDGGISIWTGTQYPFETREQTARVLGLPHEAVRLTVTPMGGAFGGKTDMHVSVPLAALAAQHLRRPVRVAMDRTESILSSTKRHAFEMDFSVGLDGQGRLLAVEAEIAADAGPYCGQSQWVMEQACIFACGPYRVPASRVRGVVARTNNCSGGAFRGYGINQVAFALESLLDEAAAELGMDPMELRLCNLLREGDCTPAGERLEGHVAAVDTMRACRDAVESVVPQEPPSPGWARGVGVACAYKNVGWGRGSRDDGHARLQLASDGTVLLWASAADMGQGASAGLARLAAEALGVPSEIVRTMPVDTSCLPRGNGGSAQRLTFCAGNAVLGAARAFRVALREHEERLFGRWASPAGVDVDRRSRRGMVEGAAVALGDLARALEEEGTVLCVKESYVAPVTYSLDDRERIRPEEYRLYPAYSYCTALAVVEVEEGTGRVRVTDIAVFQDVGHAIDPVIITGQLEGSCLQALGYALTEQYRLDNGVPQGTSLGRLGLPGIEEIPRYHTILIESADLHGPMGAKGISEVAMVPVCPAIANAIARATGSRGRSLPLRPRVRKDGRE